MPDNYIAPRWFDVTVNPSGPSGGYADPRERSGEDYGQPPPPLPVDAQPAPYEPPGPPLPPDPNIGGPAPVDPQPGPPEPFPPLEQLPRPEHFGPALPPDNRYQGRYEDRERQEQAGALELVLRDYATQGYDFEEFLRDYGLDTELDPTQRRGFEAVYDDALRSAPPQPPVDDSLVWPWEPGWSEAVPWWKKYLVPIVDPQVQRRAPGTIFGPPSPFEPPVIVERGPPNNPTPADVRRQGAAERDRIIREAAEQARRDTRIRSGASIVIEGIARAVVRGIPIPVIRAGREILEPGVLGPGTVPLPEQISRSIPRDMPEPVIVQPPPLPLPSPPVPEITPPWPAQTTQPQPQPQPSSVPSPTLPSPAPSPSPRPAAIGQLASLWTNVIRGSNATQWPWRQPFTDPLTQTFADSTPRVYGASSPSIKAPAGTPAAGTNPLTGSNTWLVQSSPPRTPTRTRTRTSECNCKPKRRKKSRDCNVRGNLMWVSGPKKGKPAGSRCVRFKGLK